MLFPHLTSSQHQKMQMLHFEWEEVLIRSDSNAWAFKWITKEQNIKFMMDKPKMTVASDKLVYIISPERLHRLKK